MIITDMQQLREVPVGETAVLVLQFKVTKADLDDVEPCKFCVLDGLVCSCCCSTDRPDGKEVKFIKV